MTLESMKLECEQMQQRLETVIPEELNLIIYFGKEIAAYNARIGYMLATAKKLVRQRKCSEIGDTIIKIAKEQYLSSKAQNALVESIANEEMFLVDWLDRMNADCVHLLDFIRTIVSKEKEEMRLQGFVDNMNSMNRNY